MTNECELNSSIEKICRLCATHQDNGQVLFAIGSEEMDKLVNSICCLLDIEFRNDGELPNWLCSRCQTEAARMEEFIQLVKNGQVKLIELVTHWNVDIKIEEEKFIETNSFITQAPSIEDSEYSHDIEIKAEPKCTKYRKTDNKEHKADCIEQQTERLVSHSKRLRRRPQRLLEEIQMKAFSKSLCNVKPLPKKLENAIDSCTLITSQSIAEVRTAVGNALGEIVEVAPSKDSDNICLPKTYFICEYCKDVFHRQNAFLKHIETHKNCIYECHECLQNFSNKNCFSQHQTLTGHVGVGIIEDLGTQTEQMNSDKELSQLGATTAINIVVGANGQITSIDQVGSSEEGKNHVSQECSKEHPSSVCSSSKDINVSYNSCVKKLSNSNKYACLVCRKTFNDLYAVRRHHKMVHIAERKYKCSLCPAAFKTKSNYDYHLAKHTGKKSFTCNVCPKSFHSKDQWNIHNRVHTGEKPFKCLVCLKTFANRCNLVTHKRVHTGERPYKCSNCESTFKHATHLKKHKKIHLKDTPEARTSGVQSIPKEKNFHLPTKIDAIPALAKLNSIADKPDSLLKPLVPIITNVQVLPAVSAYPKSFQTKDISTSTLQSNILSSELPQTNGEISPAIAENPIYNPSFKFQCPVCQKKFKESGALRKHHRTHTGERPYKCPMCPKSFADPSNFNKHRMLHKNATHALKNVCALKSSTMQELRQMLAEQSVTITSYAAQSSTNEGVSDPDPDGLETFSRLLPCVSDVVDIDETG